MAPRMTEQEKKAFQYWKANPVQWVQDWFRVTPEDYQADILNSILVDNKLPRSAVKSSHGVGKTTTLAWTGIHFLVFIEDSRLVATAPTRSQLSDILWPEYAKWMHKAPEQIQQQWDISGGHIRNKLKPKTWFGLGRTSNRPENLQGFHADNILVQIDEASGVPQSVFEVIEGILSDAEESDSTALLMLTGNPNFTSGELYDAFNRNSQLYNLFTVSGDKTTVPEPSDGRFYVSKRVTEAYRRTMASKYGADSAVYDVRVRGKFPMVDDRVVIPLEWAQAATSVPLPKFDIVQDAFIVVADVARFGGDESTIGVYRCGHCLSLKGYTKRSTTETARLVMQQVDAIREARGRVSRIIVDEPGVGGGVIDTLNDNGYMVTPYNGGLTMREGTDPADDIRMYANRRARDWWNIRRKMEHRLIHIPDDETLVNQLASVQYDYNDKEKIKIESKRDMRDRLGDNASPDRADNVVMGLAEWYSMANKTLPDLTPKDLEFGIELSRDRPRLDMELA